MGAGICTYKMHPLIILVVREVWRISGWVGFSQPQLYVRTTCKSLKHADTAVHPKGSDLIGWGQGLDIRVSKSSSADLNALRKLKATRHNDSIIRQICNRLNNHTRTPLEAQWLRFRASAAGGRGPITGWGTKILLATWCCQKRKKGILSNHAKEDTS